MLAVEFGNRCSKSNWSREKWRIMPPPREAWFLCRRLPPPTLPMSTLPTSHFPITTKTGQARLKRLLLPQLLPMNHTPFLPPLPIPNSPTKRPTQLLPEEPPSSPLSTTPIDRTQGSLVQLRISILLIYRTLIILLQGRCHHQGRCTHCLRTT